VTRRFALPLVLAFLAAGACGGPRREAASFATRSDAGQAVPTWVPSSASELKLQEEEADGAFWLRFRLPASDRPALESELLRIPDGQVATLTFRAPKGADWWFRGLVQVVPARERTVIAADVYSGAGRAVPQKTFVAFDRASDSVYAWGTGR
jgi:hypothetical protein